MLLQGFFNGIDPRDLVLSSTAIEFLPAVQSRGKPLTSLHSLLSSRVGCGDHQRISVVGQLNHVITHRSCLSVHIFYLWIGYLQGIDRDAVAPCT